MKEPIRAVAQSVVSVGRIIAAIWHCLWALAYFALAFWLATSFPNWFGWTLCAFFSLRGAYQLFDASEAYLSARPPLRQEDLERALRARSLYIPMDHHRARQEKRRPQQ